MSVPGRAPHQISRSDRATTGLGRALDDLERIKALVEAGVITPGEAQAMNTVALCLPA